MSNSKTFRAMTVKEKTQTRAHMRAAGKDPKDYSALEFVEYSKAHGLMTGENYSRSEPTGNMTGTRTTGTEGGDNSAADSDTSMAMPEGAEGDTGGAESEGEGEGEGKGKGGESEASEGEGEASEGEASEGEGEQSEGEGEQSEGEQSEGESESEAESEPKPEAESMMEKPVFDIVWKCIDWHTANDKHAKGGTSGLSERAVRALISEAVAQASSEQSSKEATFKRRDFKSATFDLKHPMLQSILDSLACGLNPYMFGEAGSGKTTIAMQAATTMGLPFYLVGKVDDIFTLTGYNDAHGNYVETDFYKCFTGGGVCLMDEMDRYSAPALVVTNAATDQRIMAFPCGVKKAHPDFYLIGAGNTIGNGADRKYTSAQNLDKSTLNRFDKYHVPYDLDLERGVALKINPNCGKWVDIVQKTRSALATMGLDAMATPRNTKNGAKLLAFGKPLADVIQSQLLEGNSPDTIKQLKKIIEAAA